MPLRSGRSGGGSRGIRGTRVSNRTPRSSSTGSKGFRVNFGNRAPRATTDIPDTGTSDRTDLRPTMRPRRFGPSGTGWKLVGIILGVIVFGVCTCVALALILQALGYGQ